jgi:hypothetical protein
MTMLPASALVHVLVTALLGQAAEPTSQIDEPVTVVPVAPGGVLEHLGPLLLTAIVFTVVGLVLFAICLWLIVKLAPFSIRKEIEEDQNTALGIIIGAMILGIAMILSAAIHG